ncbi:MAG: AMP-binding protein, partial [Candidatus Omnitrophica bacterium]|nr:AMP-binding protein [Candidatus Omnitrophota bacterium]
MIDFLLNNFEQYKKEEAIVWRDKVYSYEWLLNRVRHYQTEIQTRNIAPGDVVVLEADFSPNAIAVLLALIDHRSIVVPLTKMVISKKAEFFSIAKPEYILAVDSDDQISLSRLPYDPEYPFYNVLREKKHPGLVLFSSGSTGKSKAVVHDFVSILNKYKKPRKSLRAVTFLLYDHIGGINTLFYLLANGGCVITVQDRNPDTVLSTIERYRVELLPTSPTFLNLILLSEAYQNFDLSSLKRITYGTEPMPESTLKRLHAVFPDVDILQTYGLSEVGILSSKSKSSDSLWMKVGGEGFQTRVVDGILHIKAESSMLGYLNAPSPFTEDGWFNTQDAVEEDGEYIRVLGRISDLINVGGQKVYPAEVESVIQQMDNVIEVSVFGENNPITGQIVCARVTPRVEQEEKEFIKSIKKHCRSHMESFKVPVK